TADWNLDGGANITGSHNRIEYNGVKMVYAGAAPLSEDEIQSLRRMIEGGDLESGAGGLETRPPREDYYAAVLGRVRPARRLNVLLHARTRPARIYAPPPPPPPGTPPAPPLRQPPP